MSINVSGAEPSVVQHTHQGFELLTAYSPLAGVRWGLARRLEHLGGKFGHHRREIFYVFVLILAEFSEFLIYRPYFR